jgi:hypothetical protein
MGRYMKNKKIFGVLLTLTIVFSISSIATINLIPTNAIMSNPESVAVTFTVLPDGTVQISISKNDSTYVGENYSEYLIVTDDTIIESYSNYWNPDPSYPYQYEKIIIDISNDILSASIDRDEWLNASTIPFDLSATVNFNYNGDTATIGVSEYVGGLNFTQLLESMLNTSLPFGIPSFSGSLTINNGVLSGSITFQANELFESPMTININLSNLTASISGSGSVIYQGIIFNSSHLDYADALFDNLTGTGPGSMYNSTYGVLEATTATFSYTNQTFTLGEGADINFNLVVENDTIGIYRNMFTMLSSMITTSSDDNEIAVMAYEFEQIFTHSTGSILINYNEALETASLTANLNIDFGTVLDNLMPPIYTGSWPSGFNVTDPLDLNTSSFFEFYFLTVVAASGITSGSANMNFEMEGDDGTYNMTASASIPWTGLIDDISDILNSSIYEVFDEDWWFNENVTITSAHREMEYSESAGVSLSWGSQTYEGGVDAISYFLNNYDPDIVDYYSLFEAMYPLQFNSSITGLDVSLDNLYWNYTQINNTGRTEVLSGFSIKPPVHSVNASWWDLNSLFEAYTGSFPVSGNQLGIVVAGGNNGTHHTILSYEGLTAPDDTVNDPTGNAFIMFWDNASVPDLKDLRFSVTSGAISGYYLDPNYMPSSISVPGLSISLEVNSISDATGLIIEEATGMPDEGDAWNPVGLYVNITATESISSIDAWLTYYYSDADVIAAGVDENSLTIFWWNPSTSSYEAVPEIIRNTDGNWVKGHLTHLSVFALFGATPIWGQLWFIAVIAVVAVIVVISVAYIFMRRRAGVKGTLAS